MTYEDLEKSTFDEIFINKEGKTLFFICKDTETCKNLTQLLATNKFCIKGYCGQKINYTIELNFIETAYKLVVETNLTQEKNFEWVNMILKQNIEYVNTAILNKDKIPMFSLSHQVRYNLDQNCQRL